MYANIMIAVDGSPESLQAVREALAWMERGLRAEIALVNVQEAASLLQLATQDSDAIAAAAVEAGEHLMAPGAALLDAAGVGYSMEVVLGEPGPALVDLAEQINADVVMLGARGMGALESVLVGSVSKAVISRCSKPVMVVRLPEVPELPEVLGDEEQA